MLGNRRRDTTPELRLRSELHRLGLRFRVDQAVRAGAVTVRPDVVFARKRVAVFVDGCFWHSCPLHCRPPASNQSYWEPKLARNVLRDSLVARLLADDGWTVVRVWEHETVAEAARRVLGALSASVGPQRSVAAGEALASLESAS